MNRNRDVADIHRGFVPPKHILLALVFVVAAGCTGDRHVADSVQLPAACGAPLAPHRGESPLDDQIAGLQDEIRSTPSSLARVEELGWLFVARARSADDAGFYWLAQESARCLAAGNPEHMGAMLLEGHVLHNLHQFREAERLARRLVEARGSPFDHGLLGDVLMEQGNLDEAATEYQSMMDLRPGLQSYSRAAHLRWLRGDVAGAVEAMRMAADAAGPRDAEAAAWVHSRLAFYQLQAGTMPSALESSEAALDFQPDHAGALVTRGRILLAAGHARDAIPFLEMTLRRNPLPEAQWILAEALEVAGRADEARTLEASIMAAGGARDARTVALLLATRGQDPTEALDLATEELAVREDPLTLDAYAWALAAAGRSDEAEAAIQRALAAGTEDGRLFFHAGAIAALGRRDGSACGWFGKAIAMEQTLLPSEQRGLRALSGNCSEIPR